MIKYSEIAIVLVLSPVLAVTYIVVAFMVWLFSGSPVIYKQERVGRGKVPFTLYKFRTMHVGTAEAASHLVGKSSITPLGRLLRITKLDELPQLINVLRGEMSLVGPRPCLPSQSELIHYRDKMGVFKIRPGITGLAQIKKIDMSTPRLLAKYDALMVKNMSLVLYLWIIFQTIRGAGSVDPASK